MFRYLAVVTALSAFMEASAHEYVTFDEMTSAFGMDIANTNIATETVAPGLHVLFGVGGNVVASVGDQGVLVVDSQLPEMIPKIETAIESLGGGSIDFVINTHWHWDHANGNPVLGRQGSWMVSHANSRRMMAGSHVIDLVSLAYEQPPYPAEAMPVITFDDHMQFHFNGDTVDLFNFGPAHTTGDADSIVVPGHGPVMGYQDLADFIDMLEAVRNRISALIDQGLSLEEVIAEEPTAEFNDRYGDPARFINRAYTILPRCMCARLSIY